MNNLTQIVVGLGEVGGAVREVLGCDGHDPYKGVIAEGHYDVMHIAIPYNPAHYDFAALINEYKTKFTPDLIIIHSTVPLGTSRGLNAVHSPIRGVHPHLAKGIRTFVKFFGGERAEEAAALFEAKGVKTKCTSRQEDTEAAKLWDTTQYGVMILLNKEIHAYCEENGLDFDIVYKEFNASYNEGYQELGRKEVVRPYLKYMDGPIGGHCVVQNSHLLNSLSAERIKKANADYAAVNMKAPQEVVGKTA
ncbi:MAG: hypothetical protein V4519_05130 [Patescibacteria group bacterium]